MRNSAIASVEALESRSLLSVMVGPGGSLAEQAGAVVGPAARGGSPKPTFSIRLEVVALHELGHALGLPHNSDPNSIMYATYNSNYSIANFGSDAAVQLAKDDIASTGWNDSDHNGKIDISYSFIQDGALLDQRRASSRYSQLGSVSSWQQIVVTELKRWAAATGAFEVTAFGGDGIENGVRNGGTGLVQDDPNFGDIRIGAHKMDGALKTLAHTYYPPSVNNNSFAGDVHFDVDEAWVVSDQPALASATSVPTVVMSGTSSASVFAGHKPITPDDGNVLDQLTEMLV